MADLRRALRALWKHPAYATVAIATLAVAIGGATAVFSLLNAVVLRPLPVTEPDRLVLIRDALPPRLPQFSVSPGRFVEWQQRTHSFDALAAIQGTGVNLTGAGDPERVQGARVSAALFGMLGATPILGRTFRPDEDAPGAEQVVILSEGLWRSHFGGARDVVGRTVLLNDRPATIVGVLPDRYAFLPSSVRLWLPLALTDPQRRQYGSHYLNVLGRLKPGVTVAAARADLEHAAAQIESIDGNKGWTTLTFPLLDYIVGDTKTALYVLAAAVALVLLIACANIANLLLARGIARQRELGLRAALGATRGRLVRQMLVENLVVGGVGSALGLGLAWGLLELIVASPSTDLPRAQAIGLDGATLACALALALTTPLVFGLLPAAHASRTDLRDILAQTGRSAAGSLRARTRAALIVGEVALAVMLVAGATLLVRSFGRLIHVSPGFSTDQQIEVPLQLPVTRYATDAARDAFWSALVARAEALPDIRSAGITESLPLIDDYVTIFEIPGKTSTDPSEMPNTNFYAVSPDYFTTMGIPLLRGRGIAASDGPDAERVVVISDTLARRYFGTEDPVGRQLRAHQGPTSDAFARIVGVVGDVKQYGLDATTTLQVYEPARQHAYFDANMLVVRSTRAPADVGTEVRGLVRTLDANLPVATPRTMASVLDASIGSQRFTAMLLGAFGVVALLLAAIGVYGLVSFTVGQRAQEIGLRVALGAQPRSLLGLVFRQGLGLTLAGIGIGLGAGLWLAGYLKSQLFEVAPRDPLAFGLAPAVLVLATIVACYAPARRALKVDPAKVLRE